MSHNRKLTATDAKMKAKERFAPFADTLRFALKNRFYRELCGKTLSL
jgi:hypothetical protein